MRPLKVFLPANANNVLYIFNDFETRQNRTYSVSVQHFCARFEENECSSDCERCGRRRHSFWNDSVGDLLNYLCEPRPWASKIVAIAHNAKAFDLHFIINGAIKFIWKPEIIKFGLNIISMKMEHLVILDSVSVPCALRKLREAFGLQDTKSWYPHYFNTEENLDYFGPMPDKLYYGVNEMGEGSVRNS